MSLNASEIVASIGVVVAIIALLRPEIALLVNRAVARLSIHLNTRIEIGFSDYGPTIGIFGTIRSKGKQFFITSIKLRVANPNGESHEFDWCIFRSPIVKVQEITNVEAEVAVPFMVPKNSAKTISILFQDTSIAEEIREPFLELKERLGDRDYDSVMGMEWFDIHNTIYEKFYWEAGEYQFLLSIYDEDGAVCCEKNFGFCLLEPESEFLGVNVETMINAALGRQGEVVYHAACNIHSIDA